MACGTPLVVTGGRALHEVTGDCALVVPAGNSDALARALRTLLEDPALRHEMSTCGVTRSAGFTWRATAEATVRVYRDLLTHQRNGVSC